MAIVARGLGQPEDGSLVAGGLGTTEPDLNAMVASLSGSGTITATLTASGEPPAADDYVGHHLSGVNLARKRKAAVDALKKRRRALLDPTPAYISASLSGRGRVRADLHGEYVDAAFDLLADEDELFLLLV